MKVDLKEKETSLKSRNICEDYTVSDFLDFIDGANTEFLQDSIKDFIDLRYLDFTTSDLLEWLKDNYSYFDDFVDEYGYNGDFISVLQGTRVYAVEMEILKNKNEIIEAYALEKLRDNNIEELSYEDYWTLEENLNDLDEPHLFSKIDDFCEKLAYEISNSKKDDINTRKQK